jgi:hypothetical protein
MVKEAAYVDMSSSEFFVSQFLKELDIWWIYESPVFVYDEKERPRVWTPDFYLPKLGMYVEVCGLENEKSYEYRKQIYKKNKIPVIFVQFYKEEKKWKNYLIKRILEIEETRHSEIMSKFESLQRPC